MKIDFDKITNDRWIKVARALEANGYCATAAASALGWHRQQIYDVVHRLKRHGLIQKDVIVSGYLGTQARTGGLRLGKITEVSREYDLAFQRWLVKQVPEEASLADLLLSMAYDVYMDEVEEKGRKAA